MIQFVEFHLSSASLRFSRFGVGNKDMILTVSRADRMPQTQPAHPQPVSLGNGESSRSAQGVGADTLHFSARYKLPKDKRPRVFFETPREQTHASTPTKSQTSFSDFRPLHWLKRIAFVSAISSSIFVDTGYYLFNKDPIQMVQSVVRNTRPIPKELKDSLKPFFDNAPFPIDFDHLQVVPEFLPFFQDRDHVIPGFHGTVVLQDRDYQDYMNFESLPSNRKHSLKVMFAHELAHLVQMQMLGKDAFLTRISQQSLQNDNVYETSSPTFQRIFKEKDANNKLDDPTMFVHPELTLEQNAVLIELFIGNRLTP